MAMAGRGKKGGNYKYGYQGSEKDNDISGDGNSYTTEFRQLDPRLGRWFTPDPVFQPWQSPYNSMDGNPVSLTDRSGLKPDGGGKHLDKSRRRSKDSGINDNQKQNFSSRNAFGTKKLQNPLSGIGAELSNAKIGVSVGKIKNIASSVNLYFKENLLLNAELINSCRTDWRDWEKECDTKHKHSIKRAWKWFLRRIGFPEIDWVTEKTTTQRWEGNVPIAHRQPYPGSEMHVKVDLGDDDKVKKIVFQTFDVPDVVTVTDNKTGKIYVLSDGSTPVLQKTEFTLPAGVTDITIDVVPVNVGAGFESNYRVYAVYTEERVYVRTQKHFLGIFKFYDKVKELPKDQSDKKIETLQKAGAPVKKSSENYNIYKNQ